MKQKTKKFYVLYNMRDDDIRWRKTKPKPVESPFDVVIPIKLRFKIPDLHIDTLEAEINIPEGEVKEMVTDLVKREDERPIPPESEIFQDIKPMIPDDTDPENVLQRVNKVARDLDVGDNWEEDFFDDFGQAVYNYFSAGDILEDVELERWLRTVVLHARKEGTTFSDMAEKMINKRVEKPHVEEDYKNEDPDDNSGGGEN